MEDSLQFLILQSIAKNIHEFCYEMSVSKGSNFFFDFIVLSLILDVKQDKQDKKAKTKNHQTQVLVQACSSSMSVRKL